MISHGHVFPRSDGVRARCGGPALCAHCRVEQEAQTAGAIRAAVEQRNAVEKRAVSGPEGTDANGRPA